MEIVQESKLKKIVWDSDKDDDEALYIIIKLAKLLAHLRAVVPTWGTSGSGGTDYAYATAMKEEPDRAMEQLRNIARGFALSNARNYITKDDLSLPVKVVLSTASIDRVNIFDLLIAHEGTLTTKTITESLNVSPPTAYRIMVELKAVGLVDMPESGTTTEEKQIILKEDFKWFLKEEFSKLREGFIPTDNRDEMKRDQDQDDEGSLKEKTPLITSNYDYSCYKCKKDNHGADVYQTNSKHDYENHWLKHNIKTTCYPNKADLELHGWEPQGRDWEKE